MAKYNFKVGDLVRIREWDDMKREFGTDRFGSIITRCRFVPGMEHLCGQCAKITEINDEHVSLHFVNRDYKSDYVWHYDTSMIEPVKKCNEQIVIASDGKTTMARRYVDGAVFDSAKAVCSPDDEFDFATGAKLAFERLMEQKKPLYEKGDLVKVVGCTRYKHSIVVGTIARVVSVCDNEAIECSGFSYFGKGFTHSQFLHPDDLEKFVEG